MNDIQLCLLAARTLISDPADWTQRCIARDYHDVGVTANRDAAAKWCAMGAIAATRAPSLVRSRAFVTLETLADGVARFNDGHTHAEVMALFDRAIERAADPC